MNLTIEMAADISCPWCYISMRHLQMALAQLRAERPTVQLQLKCHPFELNPTAPAEGLDRQRHRSAALGSWARAQELDAAVVRAGLEAGIAFDFNKVTRTPNTQDTHRLLWLALGEDGAQGLVAPQGVEVQQALAEILFQGYFVHGRNLNNRVSLANLTAFCGWNPNYIITFLAGNEGVAAVRQLEITARTTGIASVPFLLFNGIYGISGVQSVAVLHSFMEQILDAAPVPSTRRAGNVGASDSYAEGICNS
jgi:predicted DsbA family dithiol-disulfide isomerase